MTGGFGFPNYATQRKTPSSQAVGAALLQQGQQAPAGPTGPGLETGMGGGGFQSPDASPTASMGGDPQREEGARRMGAGGQLDDSADIGDGTHSANAVNIAIGEALTRMGGGYATNPNPFKPRDRNMQLVRQLGLSEVEAQLLAQTGGL